MSKWFIIGVIATVVLVVGLIVVSVVFDLDGRTGTTCHTTKTGKRTFVTTCH